MGLKEKVESVDIFVLELVSERNWEDTESSYNEVLDELKTNLGLHPNLESLRLLDMLAKGVDLLRAQKKTRKRDKDIQSHIDKLNETP